MSGSVFLAQTRHPLEKEGFPCTASAVSARAPNNDPGQKPKYYSHSGLAIWRKRFHKNWSRRSTSPRSPVTALCDTERKRAFTWSGVTRQKRSNTSLSVYIRMQLAYNTPGGLIPLTRKIKHVPPDDTLPCLKRSTLRNRTMSTYLASILTTSSAPRIRLGDCCACAPQIVAFPQPLAPDFLRQNGEPSCAPEAPPSRANFTPL